MDTQIRPGRFTNKRVYYFAIFLLILLVLTDFSALGQTDDASYWIVPSDEPNDTITGVIMRDLDDIYLTGETGTIFKSTNMTNDYESIESFSESLNGLDFDGNMIVAVGDNGFATFTTDATIWNTIDFGVTVTEDLLNVEIKENNIWIVGTSATILYSNDSAVNWVTQTAPQNKIFNDVSFADNTTGWIVGEDGTILRTTNAGQSWITTSSGTTEHLNAIDVETSSSDRIWVVGNGGTFLISFGSNIGEVFDPVETGSTSDLLDVYSPRFNIVWAVGADSTILGYRGNEFKNVQILEDDRNDVVFQAVYAIDNDALAAGSEIYFNREGLIPAFTTDKDWQDIIFFTREVVPLLLGGLWAAVQVILFALFIGFFIGLVMATLRTINNRPLNFISTAYSDLFRNTPLLVQLFFISFGLPELGWNPPTFVDAVIALSLNTGAYQSEIIRSGILAIPKGQMEAARSLGMNNVQAMRNIILPQAVRITIPPLSNEAVIMFLNTAQLSVIAYEEITRVGQLIATTTFLWSRTFLYVALTYFIITYSITTLLRRAEKKLKIPGLGGGEI